MSTGCPPARSGHDVYTRRADRTMAVALGLQSAEEPSEKSRIETRGRLDRAPNYEFGGQEFESLRARQ